MPFHIRLVRPTKPIATRTLPSQAPKIAVVAEFCQGIAFGVGVAFVMIGAFWVMHTNGFGF